MLSILQEACDWLNAYMARWYYVDFHGQHRKRDLSFWPSGSWIVGPDRSGPYFARKKFPPRFGFFGPEPVPKPGPRTDIQIFGTAVHVIDFEHLMTPINDEAFLGNLWKELNVFSKLFWLFLELSDSFMVMQLNPCRFVNSSLYCQGNSDTFTD